MLRNITLFLWDESGATAIEYGFILSMISMLIVGSLVTIGNSVVTPFTTANNELAGNARSSSGQ